MNTILISGTIFSSILQWLYPIQNSGSTFVGVFIVENTIICANVGDSRAVLARKACDSELYAVPLSEDHKPSLERERQRIVRCGGRVHSQKGIFFLSKLIEFANVLYRLLRELSRIAESLDEYSGYTWTRNDKESWR